MPDLTAIADYVTAAAVLVGAARVAWLWVLEEREEEAADREHEEATKGD